MILKRKLKICDNCKEETYLFSGKLCKNCTTKLKLSKVKIVKPKKKPLPTIAALKKEARYWFQRWIRLRDLNSTCCYGSNIILSDIKTYDACHYLKFELYPEAGFDEDNVHGGTKGENIRDNTIAYRRELIKRKSEEWINSLEEKYCVNRQTQYKWDRTFLQDIIDKYKILCKEIENNK
jgi:Bacteriophage Lambda NinG protein